MAIRFYTLDQTKAALGKSEDDIRQLVRDGQLQGFRNGPLLMFKADQVEHLKQQMSEVAATGQRPGAVAVDESPRIPFALRYRREGGAITMSYAWLDLTSQLFIFVAVAVLTLWQIAGPFLRSPRSIQMFLLAWLVPWLILGYIGLAHLINWTHITLGRDILRVRHRPLCWPNWGITVARHDIRKVDIEQSYFRSGPAGGSMKCRLYAEFATGKVRHLSPWVSSGKRLEFVAAQINEWRSGEDTHDLPSATPSAA